MSDDSSPEDDTPDGEAPTDFTSTVYDQLRALAGSYFKRQPEGHTLQPTALVHEARCWTCH